MTLFSQLPAAVDEPKALRSYPNALDGQPPAELAARLFDNAMSIFNDPMAYWMRRQWESLSPEEVEEARDADWTPDDTADYLGIPQHGPRGEPLTERERYEWAFDVLDLVQHALELGGEGFSYQGPRSVRGWELAPGETAPRYLLEAAMADALSPQAKLRLVPVSKDAAASFIKEHHSKLPKLNPRGLLFVAGATVGDRLVAVAAMNTPSGPWKDPHNVVELTRVASDGTAHGAASKLTKRMIQLAPLAVKARGGDPARWRFITYSLSDEEGTTYKALRKYGLRPTAMTPGKVSAGGQRGALASLAAQDKIRWEAGPGAAPADWTLVEAPPEPKETPMPEAVKTTLITLANYLDNLAAQLRAGEDVDTAQAASFIERVEGVLVRYA